MRDHLRIIPILDIKLIKVNFFILHPIPPFISLQLSLPSPGFLIHKSPNAQPGHLIDLTDKIICLGSFHQNIFTVFSPNHIFPLVDLG